MKKHLFIATLALILAGCGQAPSSPSVSDDNTENKNQNGTNMEDHEGMDMEDDMDHTGCQEGEIMQDGSCVPAPEGENNMSLFERDVDPLVTTQQFRGDIQGYLATPREPGEYPGVVMIHEWWGLNDNIKNMAKLLASEGYNVFAVDLYDGEVAETSERARELASSVRENPGEAVQKMQSAVDFLQSDQGSDRIASMGWCFGGQQSLQLALNAEDLEATVIYYGQLTDDQAELQNIDWPVLGIFGEEDSSISVESVRNFEAALSELGIENNINVYEGVGHAFANPSGSNYAPEATMDAWQKTIDFLNENLKIDTMEENASEPADTAAADATFVIEGQNYEFLIDGTSNPELRVQQGDTVRIEFTSVAGFHNFVIDEFDASTETVNTGESDTIEFVADTAGTFDYYCGVGNHREQGMEGTLIVE